MIGIDIIEVERIQENMDKNPKFLKRILTETEIKYVNKFKSSVEHIAGFFCAKEAVMKALENCREISFLDIEIDHFESGKPYVKLYGNALKVFNEQSLKNIEISISQTKNYAVAMCMIS